ncbi:non-ribosomal peptide synthetase [Paraburkholderia phenazinium]|uniref:Amino acid adenylation domain-containing protein/thioester reductase domain-containing protein n=1 Tax=Paraburkholderia phenazinium TaxID=60549 RepID=A0A1G7W3A1_9BURK|nr:non-ribosomal peptide synthetase [Paraburkholderia phenazinium]SDG66413.1 amino acid adenylation domain-containing protein/thioester reductase domain-containing protein [Paraburkholderia phenazinium]
MELQSFALTQTQARMLASSDAAHNRCAVYQLDGHPDTARLGAAIAQIVAHCQPLRCRTIESERGTRFIVEPQSHTELKVIDLDEHDDFAAHSLIEGLCARNFRMDTGVPWSFTLLRAGKGSYLVFACHAALLDRFSLKPLFEALSSAYNGDSLGPELGIDQQGLLDAEQSLLACERLQADLDFWIGQIGESSFEWHAPRHENDLAGSSFTRHLDAHASHALRREAAALGMAPEVLLLLSFHVLLKRLAGTSTILTAYHQRGRMQGRDGVGYDERSRILKSEFDDAMTLRQFLRHAAARFEMADFHAEIPALEVLREMERRVPGFASPTNVLCEADTLPYDALRLGSLDASLLVPFSRRAAQHDMAVYLDVREQISFHVHSRHPQELDGLGLAFEHYLALLTRIGDSLEQKINGLDLYTPALHERGCGWSDGGPMAAPARDVLELFAESVGLHGTSPAVSGPDAVYSYAQLADAARRMAAGVAPVAAPDALIGICVSRGARIVPAMLGVLEAGAGYLPLDPHMPDERLHYIADDAQLSAVIVDDATHARIAAVVRCPVLVLDDLLADAGTQSSPVSPASARAARLPIAAATHIAYVIYTSGTTGQPKGVVIERGMLAHFVASLAGRYETGPGTRWLQFASVNFDASVVEIFNPLTHGGHLIVAPEEVRADAEALFGFLEARRITHAFLPPAILKLLPRRALPDLTSVLCGGEASDDETIRFWSKLLRLSNIYGPTETTVMATENTFGWHKLANQLGRPLPGYQIHLLDETGQVAPLGGVGEICIGGASVARGYLRRVELSEQKFQPNPFGAGRLYRSGDLGRFLPDGELEFLGRNDFQVKIRGYRIELGEIESSIVEQPEVRAAYVGTCERQGGTALVAWYVGDALNPAALRRRLASRLAHYMVPSFLIPVAALPLNLNGKIDRTRLPPPQTAPLDSSTREFDEFEQTVRAIWAEILEVPVDSIAGDSHFFQMGGHSLLAMLACHRLSSALHAQVQVKALFEDPLFDAFCARLRDASPSEAGLPPLVPVAAGAAGDVKPVPVASRLVRMIHSRSVSKPNDCAYTIVVRVDFSCETHPLRLHQALTNVLAADPVFRAQFAECDGELLLFASAVATPQISIASCDAQAIAARADVLRETALPLECAPLWRAELLLCPQHGSTTLLFCIHHAIFDGWSLKLLLDELALRYDGHTAVPNRLSWFDYCQWAPQLAASVQFATAREYWTCKLEHATLRVELPFDRLHRADNANRSLALPVRPAQVQRLKQFAEASGMTLPPVLFALHLLWLWRISGQAQLACAYPSAGRLVAGSESIYGMFVSMAVLVQDIRTRQSFADLARAVQRQMLDDQDHLLASPYDTDNPRLGALNTIFSLQSGLELDGRIGGAPYKARELPSLSSKADLCAIYYMRPDGGLEGRIEYDSSALGAASVERMAEAFQTLFEAVCQNPAAQAGELRYLSERQHAQCLAFSRGAPVPDAPMSIPVRFARVVAAHATQIAVRCGDQRLSYGELDALSHRIATGLAACVPAGTRVGLSMQKGTLLVASVLGILKAGCAYVPLDPAYPAERLRYFASNCSVATVLADPPSRDALASAGLTQLRYLDPAALAQADPVRLAPVVPDALAYVIHTSGSTGQPKGVMVEHHSVVRMTAGASVALEYGPGSISTLAASTNFDASVLDIFLALLHGGTLVVLPEEARRDPLLMHRLLKDARVTHASLAPVVVQNLPREALPDLRLLGFGGDTLDEASAAWWAAHTRLFSLYGPTETTVMASCGQVLPGGPSRIIGKPLPGYCLYVLNGQQQLAPPGTVGEIYIGGENLARGYVNQSAMTMERFIVDPFSRTPYALMYRTGDLGRFLPDGTLEYFGRNDAQVKLRGFRIELGEIESCVAAAPGVEHAACAVWGDGEQRYLAAYYVAKPDANVAEAALREHAQARLPEYMVPAFFMQLDAIPASANGKLDRKALPAPAPRCGGAPPHAGIERGVADIWEALLQVRGIGRDDSFFRLGGNSILAVRMQAEVRKALGLDFHMASFYRSPTIAALAAEQHQDMIGLAINDAATPIAISDLAPPLAELTRATHTVSPRAVLLTGASGFLGIYLLHELSQQVDKVYCLQRCDQAAAGLEILVKKAAEAGLKIDFSRVEVIPADLAATALGLDSAAWRRLADSVEAILHCGAFVHHLHSYAEMKQANVGGTEALLRLALTGRHKPLCFVSTMSVPETLSGARWIEERVSGALPQRDNGYLLSKWVGEQRVAECARRFGLSAVIARAGNITGDSRSGYSNYAHNHFWLYNKGCIQLGAYPGTGQQIEMMPVDRLAEAVTALALHPRDGLRVANLSNPEKLAVDQWFDAFAQAGFRLRREAPEQWQRRLADVDPANGLALIRDFYIGDLSARPLPVEQTGTLAELAKYGVDLSFDYRSLIRLYLTYLRAQGFIEEPAPAQTQLV